jgi:hypothetical protein
MSSSFPAQVLQQAQYDARVGGQGMDRNPFQRAQDFLRNKLQPAINPATATPAQQTDIDARNAKKAIEELQKAKNVKQLKQLGQTGGQLFGLGRQLITGGSQLLVGDGSHLPLLAAMQTSNAIDTFKSKPQTTPKTEIDPKLFPKAVEGGYSISPKVRKELAEERLKYTPDPAPTPDPTLTSDPAPSGAKLDPNATEEYKTAFRAGEKKKDDMLKYFGSQNNGENLKIWAEKNPALAWKEYKKAGMAGKEPFGYNDVEFGKLKQNPAEAAKKSGIEKLYEGQVEQTEQEKAAQAFKNFYVDELKGLNVGQYKDMDANSFSVDPSTLLEKSVDFNIPGLAGTLGNYGTADYGELLKQYPNIFSNK